MRARLSEVGRFCVALYVLVFLALACSGGNEPGEAAVSPSASASAAPTAGATSSPSPSADDIPELDALLTEPLPREAARTVSLERRPDSPFSAWNPESLVLYDTVLGVETNLGKGFLGGFSPDASTMAVMAPSASGLQGQVSLIDLGTLLSRELDVFGYASFVDENHLYVPRGGVSAFDIRSGELIELADIDDPLLLARLEHMSTGGGQVTPDGRFRLIRAWDGPDDPCRGTPEEDYSLCRAEVFEQWTVEEIGTGRAVLALRAYQVRPAAPGELVVATSPVCRAESEALEWCAETLQRLRSDDPEGEFPLEYAEGTSNIYIVEIETGLVEFVATAKFSANTRVEPSNWPLAANADHVVWTDSYCAPERGRTFVFGRDARELIELDAGFWLTLTPGGQIGLGEFGPRAILDSETFEWRTVLPEGVSRFAQSSDGRYLAVGAVLGHGGLCG